MKNSVLFIIITLSLLIASPLLASEPSQKPTRKPAISESKATTIAAQIIEINHKKRIITLKQKDNSILQIELANTVTNLNKLKIGDNISIDVLETMAVFVEKNAGKKLRKQTYETVKVELPGQKTLQTRIKVEETTASVEAIDLEKRLITMKFHDGKKQTYFVSRKTKNLEKLNTNDQILFRYTKAKGIRLVKEENISPAPVTPSIAPENKEQPAKAPH